MAFLDFGPRLKEVTVQAINEMRERAMVAVNNLDKTNFRKKLKGDDILLTRSISPNKLLWDEYVIPLVMAAPIFTTTALSGSPANVGGYFPWHPDKFQGGLWLFEADIAIADSASIVTCQLYSGTVLQEVTTQQTGLQRIRSGTMPMPTESANIWVRLFTSNSSHAASLGGAKLIFIPS